MTPNTQPVIIVRGLKTNFVGCVVLLPLSAVNDLAGLSARHLARVTYSIPLGNTTFHSFQVELHLAVSKLLLMLIFCAKYAIVGMSVQKCLGPPPLFLVVELMTFAQVTCAKEHYQQRLSAVVDMATIITSFYGSQFCCRIDSVVCV